MRIISLITAGSLLVSVAISENDISIANNIQRIPRALVLQPRIKINTNYDNDEGPFDFITNWLSRIINPPKKPSLSQSSILSPVRIAGNNDVFIKKLQSTPHRNSPIFMKVINADRNNVPLSMPLMNSYQKPHFSMSSTRQMSMQSGGFHPISSSTSNPIWSQSLTPQSYYSSGHTNNIYESPSGTKFGYNNYDNHFKNFKYTFGYENNPILNQSDPQYQYNENYQKWRPQRYYPNYQSLHLPYNSYHQPQNDYVNYDFHNSIPSTRNKFSNYVGNSADLSNYLRNLIHQGHVSDTVAIKTIDDKDEGNYTTNLQDRENINKKSKYRNDELAKTTLILMKASTSPPDNIDIYRLDRMVPTNPTYKNRYWTRITQPTMKIISSTERINSDQTAESSKKEQKYSSSEIEEILAPDLKTWNELVDHDRDNDTDLKINSNHTIIMKNELTAENGTTLHENVSQGRRDEVITDTHLKLLRPLSNVTKLTSRSSRNWKPMESSKHHEATVLMGNLTKIENATSETLKRIMNLTSNNFTSVKRNLPRLKNNQNGVRIVKSVKSSISMTTSRGARKAEMKN